MEKFGTIELPTVSPSIDLEPCPELGDDTYIQSSSNVLFTDFEGRVLVLERSGRVFFGLNKQGAQVWLAIQRPRRLGALAEAAKLSTGWRSLQPWLEKMIGYGLIEVDPLFSKGARRLPMSQLQKVAYAHRLATRADENLSFAQLPLKIASEVGKKG